ncbi:MAG: Clp protease N-terminal domain-containing protein [Bryobacteraceae bacterium]
MFERYTEAARRSIFFARYEASKFGSRLIEPEHLLLGLLREDRTLAGRLSFDEIRAAIARTFPAARSVCTSVDLPLSESGKRVLTAAAEEATELSHRHIGTEHLLLGLLREENTLAWILLRQNGLDANLFRQEITERAREQVAEKTRTGRRVVQSGRLGALVETLNGLIVKSDRQLRALPVVTVEEPKEALGQLIDWATTHHQWLACALSEPTVVASGYPPKEWAVIQHYHSFPWLKLTEICLP